MQRLQKEIIDLGLATFEEINEAIFSSPGFGLVEALGQNLGEEREAEILEKLAQSLHMPLIEDSKVRVDSGLSGPYGGQIVNLSSRYRALPLGVATAGAKPCLVLALSDPYDKEAIVAFSRLFNCPAKIVIARAQAIKRGLDEFIELSRSPLAKEKLRAAAQIDGTGEIFDQEAEKALHQVVATSVKHTAEQVEIDLNNPFARVIFRIDQEKSSTVDISVDPWAIASALMRKAYGIERDQGCCRAIARVEFKSVGIDCHVALEGQIPSMHAAKEGKLGAARVLLENFAIDTAENPVFWRALSESTSVKLRRICSYPGEGIVIVVSNDNAARNLALRSLAELDVEAEVIESVDEAGGLSRLIKDAAGRKVYGGAVGGDVFEVLKLLMKLKPAEQSIVKGIVAFSQVARNCFFCADSYELDADEIALLPDYLGLTSRRASRSGGCLLCCGRGFLGKLGICSVLPFGREGILELNQIDDYQEILRLLAESDFSCLLEDGMQRVLDGECPLELVTAALPAPDVKYQEICKKLFSQGGRGKLRNVGADSPIMGVGVFRPGKEGLSALSETRRSLGAPRPQSVPNKAEASGRTAPLLLVIDDDPDQRAILRRVFEMAGYRVEVAADGMDGIVSAAHSLPDVVVVDFMMPEMDGRETIKRLRGNKSTAGIPIMALTAYPDPDVEYGLFKSGADDFCPKSVAKKVLLKRIERLLQTSR